MSRVYVGNLGPYAERDELQREFSKFGKLKDVWIARNPPGFAFVMYHDMEDSKEAVRLMDGKRVCGTSIKVELSNSEPKTPQRRSFGGDSDRGRRGPPPRSPPQRESPRGPPSRGPPPRGAPVRGPPREMRPPLDRSYVSEERDRYRERAAPSPRERSAPERPPRYEEIYPARPAYRREPPAQPEPRYNDRYESSAYSDPPQYRDRYEDSYRTGRPERRASPPPRGPPVRGGPPARGPPALRGPPPARGMIRRSPPRRPRSPPHAWNGRSRSPLY